MNTLSPRKYLLWILPPLEELRAPRLVVDSIVLQRFEARRSNGGGPGAFRFFFFLTTCESVSPVEGNGNEEGSPGTAIGERFLVICNEFDRRSWPYR